MLITLLCVALIVWIVFVVADSAFQEPARTVIKMVVGVLVIVYLVALLLGAPLYPTHWPRSF